MLLEALARCEGDGEPRCQGSGALFQGGVCRRCVSSTKNARRPRTATKRPTPIPGLATSKDDYALETYVLRHDHYQIELLANLDQVPEAGAIVVATFRKPKGGSGFPARVFAIAPK